MNINYTLPSVEQVFGEQRLDIFKAIGTQCPQTAFAEALGADGSWLLSSAAGYGDVCIVKGNGERAVGYASGVYEVHHVLGNARQGAGAL